MHGIDIAYFPDTTLLCTALVQSDDVSLHWNTAVHANLWPASLYLTGQPHSRHRLSTNVPARQVTTCELVTLIDQHTACVVIEAPSAVH